MLIYHHYTKVIGIKPYCLTQLQGRVTLFTLMVRNAVDERWRGFFCYLTPRSPRWGDFTFVVKETAVEFKLLLDGIAKILVGEMWRGLLLRE
jgi:hypothetical protein